MFNNLFAKQGLTLDRLRVLVEIAEAGGISRAVAGDPVRQSQYSRQVKELEDFFGVELTRRQGKSLALTPAGERLVLLTRESFSALGEFSSGCRNERVTFSVGSGESIIRWLLIEKAAQLRRELPHAAFQMNNLRTVEVIRGLQDLRLDFGVVRSDAVPRGLAKRPLGRIEYALYAPSDLARTAAAGTSIGRGKARHPEDSAVRLLSALPLVSLVGNGEFARGLEAAAQKAGSQLNIALLCDSLPSASRAVALGGCAAVLPTLARSELPDSVLEFKSAAFRSLARELALAWNPRILRLRQASATMRDALAAHLKF